MDKIYPALITINAKNDYNVRFPNFEEIITYGKTLEEAYIMAEDALKLCLFDLYQDKVDIPKAVKIEDIKLNKNQVIILIKTNLIDILKKYDNKSVKKTFTIPVWLNKEAEKAHVNFSHVLQEGLKRHLNIK
ncbi:MAG: type II toxin-antitoxin system HicB family antitoxin [Bacillota bacterium]|nr:type II toxin-antitoxin system HicB family antitoxin [Bacillota bacterium]